MSTEYTAPLSRVIPVGTPFEGLVTALDDVLDRVGLRQIDSLRVPAPWESLPPPPPSPPITEEEALAELAPFDHGPEVPGTPEDIPQTVEPSPPELEMGHRTVTMQLRALGDVVVELPGLDGVSLVLNPGGFEATLMLEEDNFSLGFTVGLGVRFAPDILRPLRRVTAEDGRVSFEADATRPHVQIELASVTVTVDHTGSLDVAGGVGVRIDEPVMIGSTGVVIESADIVLNLSGAGPRPAGTPEGWKGLLINNASLRIPDLFSGPLTATGLGIGSGGVSGTIGGGPFLLNYNPTGEPRFTGDLVGSVFGISGGLSEFSLTFQQNIPTGGSISAKLALPFFETDEPLELDIGLTADGTFTAALSSQDGLLSLHKPGLFDLEIESVGFEAAAGVFTAKLSGELTPDFGGLDWPGFKVKELAIDSEGNVRLDGGWLDLPDQYSLDFHGFKLEITQLGFGKTDDGGKWIGFSGGLKLVDGFSAGASVEGLRLAWYDDGDIKISLNGVGVEFEVPGVLRFKGEVSYRELPGDVHRFDGDIKLDLVALDMRLDAQLVVGTAGTGAARYTFFAIFLGVELPAGIPLGATGLALYGMAGLFALEMEPNKLPAESWFENDDGSPGWYLRPAEGVSDLSTKWGPSKGSLALGAGVTLGTLSDNGYTFSGKLLLAVVFPGPVLLIEGRANLLRERARLDEQAMFRALAVLDGREGTFLLGLAAEYKYGAGGELIEIAGSAEAFFDFSDADAWHLYLGEKEPREKRIRAEIFRLYESNSYFMLDARQLAMGAWVGYDKSWKFGPLRVTVEAWIEGNVVISWKPVYLHGDLWLHGKAALKVFGRGLTLTVDARFAADVFDPFHLFASFSVGIGLPWPLPDFDVTIELEWGPEGGVPPLPMPLKEIAVEHFKTTASWPLPRPSLLRPVYDTDGDGFINEGAVSPAAVAAAEAAAPPSDAPVVPLDGRPRLTFGRAVHDRPFVGTNVNFVVPARERVGDPAKNEGPLEVEYSLRKIELHKFEGGAWSLVARRSDAEPPVGDLYGSWAPVPGQGGTGVAQVKLWLWSKSAFDYTRHSGSAWDEWFTDQIEDYPCVPPPPDRVICCDFERVEATDLLRPPHKCREHEKLTIDWRYPPELNVTVLDPPFAGFHHALCFPALIPGREGAGKPNEVVVNFPEPAKFVRILIAERQAEADETCVDFRAREKSEGPNPLTEQQVTFTAIDFDGSLDPQTGIIRVIESGLSCSFALDIALPCASTYVDLTLSHFSRPATVVAFNDDGSFASQATMTDAQGVQQTIRLTGRAVTRVSVTAPQDETLLHAVCFRCVEGGGAGGQSDVTATGYKDGTPVVGPVAPTGNFLELQGEGLTSAVVRGEVCILQVCINIGPDPAQVELQEEMAQHLIDEMARWSQQGEVLEPYTDYRVKIVTHVSATGIASKEIDLVEFGYFRTEGPPGLAALSTPVGQDAAKFDSGLKDLSRYVGQTVPATVPAAGEKPPLPRPVYRAYDVGVAFNENYVDLMYRIAGRDLGLYLYDNNNRPVRDARGRLIVLSNRWGVTEELTLTESENYWITTVNGSDCAQIDTTMIPRNSTLAAADGRQVLDADTLYEARLVPLLLHEAFADYSVGDAAVGTGARLGRWAVADEGTNAAPSRWEVREGGDPPSRYVIQTSNIWGGTTAANDPVKPGTLLVYTDTPTLPAAHAEQPSNWTDYRLSVYVRAEDDDALGLVFRYSDAAHHYRFSMDRERRRRRLLKIYDGATTILAEDEFTYTLDRDYLFTIEAVGPSLRVYQDGELVFDAEDEAMDEGTVGLYSWANAGARFSDVRVDDFSLAAPTVYAFKFTTSLFTNFFHHLHSYDDETWLAAPTDAAAVAAALAAAAEPADPPSDAEARAYEQLAALAGVTTRPNPSEVQVTRLELGGGGGGTVPAPFALLVQCSEPVDWRRAHLEVLRAERAGVPVSTPMEAKLTDVTFGATQPAEESVTLLLRRAMNLTDYRVEFSDFPGPVAAPGAGALLFAEEFENVTPGLLFREDFGPNALDRYTIVDEGAYSAPSNWAVVGGRIVQSSNIYGGSTSGAVPDKPGTSALVNGSETWADVRVSAVFNSGDDDAIGLVFRYADAENYYRLSFDSQRSYRRLVKKVAGVVTVLWEEAAGYNTGQSYGLVVEAFSDRLVAYLDTVPLFNVRDGDLPAGRAGFYCWANTSARFEALEVESLASDPVLFEAAFADLSEVEFFDEPGAISGPSAWSASGGVLSQTSDIHSPSVGAEFPGTYAIAGQPHWRDVRIAARLRSEDDDAIGVMFRYADSDNYYRFSMDSQLGYRRLVKKVAGVVTVLWEDATAGYNVGQDYDLTIRAVGGELRAHLNGGPLFNVRDGDIHAGRIGFYCWSNTGAHFERVLVTDATRRVGAWVVEDEGAVSSPSVWKAAGGALLQESNIGDAAGPAYAGTQATAGDAAWTDYRLRASMRADANGALGVVFRYADADNYYRLSFDHQHNVRQLVRKQAGAFTLLWEGAGSYAVGTGFEVAVEVVGSRLVGYAGQQRLFDLTDAAHAGGRVGLYSWANAGARFERVEVREPPLEAYALLRDRFGEGDTSGWTFVDEGTSSGPSAWATFEGALRQTSNIFEPPIDRDTLGKRGTQALAGDAAWDDLVVVARLQSFDDDAVGVTLRHADSDSFYRFSMDSERGYRRLVKCVAGTFTLLWEDDFSYEVGRSYEFAFALAGASLRGYVDGVPMFAVEDADVPAGRVGLYCWGNADARFSGVRVFPLSVVSDDWLMDEAFDTLDGWTFVDEGTVAAPSQWQLADGSLQQTSDINDGQPSAAEPEKLGTYALGGDAAWTDYRLTVRLASFDDDAVGVMFRYADADNYYRLSMDSQLGYRRLIKRVGGVVSVLWEDGVSYEVKRDYVMTVDCKGTRLTGYLDGVPLFALDDADLAAGRVGLYCWANEDARFSLVQVSAPAWAAYYSFTGEEELPAGTRVRVSAGNESDFVEPAVEEAGLVRRFAATLGDRGTLRLPASGCELRLVTPGGGTAHARRFLPESDYGVLGDVRLLRKADGTAFVVALPSGGAPGSFLPPGEYRLRLTYRRDNQAAEPGSQVFSQAGVTAPEVVTLDVPWLSH